MIRVFSGGRYKPQHWMALCEIFEQGLHDVCRNDCDKCNYSFACREVSQAITFCANQSNKALANKHN